MEAKLKEREATLTDSNKEKDTTINTLKEQVSVHVWMGHLEGGGEHRDFPSLRLISPP